jgi:phage regulator Rha-like protein
MRPHLSKGRGMPEIAAGISTIRVESLVISVRGRKVIVDYDLAKLYGVTTKRLNEQIKRNSHRFPDDFMFKLTEAEAAAMRSQNATASNAKRNLRFTPNAFTEHGALMAANVLNSARAVEMSVFVVRAFVKMRETFIQNKQITSLLVDLERKLSSRLDTHEKAILHILQQMKKLTEPVPPEKVPEKKVKIGFGRE